MLSIVYAIHAQFRVNFSVLTGNSSAGAVVRRFALRRSLVSARNLLALGESSNEDEIHAMLLTRMTASFSEHVDA